MNRAANTGAAMRTAQRPRPIRRVHHWGGACCGVQKQQKPAIHQIHAPGGQRPRNHARGFVGAASGGGASAGRTAIYGSERTVAQVSNPRARKAIIFAPGVLLSWAMHSHIWG